MSPTADGHSSKDREDLYYKQLEEQQADLKKKVFIDTIFGRFIVGNNLICSQRVFHILGKVSYTKTLII